MAGLRKRIQRPGANDTPIEDPMEYVPNKANEHTKKLTTVSIRHSVEIHYAKHYYSRSNFGEDDGSKRNGIDILAVKELVEASLTHIFYYCARNDFGFVNTETRPNVQPKRFGIQKRCEDGIMLNVVLEANQINVSIFEITIITAHKKNDFFHRGGEYVLEVVNPDSSVLRKVGREGLLTEIDDISY